MELLFDSFTQVDASTTREYGGTGLGLAIVKQLCKLMNGNISVSSQPGKGSCFEFTIQLQTSDKSEAVLPTVDITGIPILVVDDNTTNREVLRGQLEEWGAIVSEAKDAKDALRVMQNKLNDEQNPAFTVAFIDMQMPKTDGMTLGKAIRGDNRFDATKMVMMTSMSSRGDAKKFAEAGFSAYFPKPTTNSDLFDSLAVVIAGGETLDQAQPLVTHHYLKSLKRPDEDESEDKGDSPAQQNDKSSKRKFAADTRLLLVEDNYINQAVALAQLQTLDLNCDVAGNGIEALQALKQCPENAPYHLIFMDCQMPDMDGYEATQHIRNGKAGKRYSDIPIVAMTANAMEGDREKCLDCGMSDYVSKPINPEVVEEKLRRWLLDG